MNYVMVPDGTGNYSISVWSNNAPSVPTTFFLVSGSTVVQTLSGVSGTFTNVVPACYRLYICVTTLQDGPLYCCLDLPCNFIDPGCCELKYSFFTSLSNPNWRFGDGTTTTDQNPVHEFTNLNTYPVEGIPSTIVTVTVGSLIITTINFPPGIWVGKDCIDSGNASTLMSSLNPTYVVFPLLSYTTRKISVKGSITMDLNYQFTDCDFCMHPSSRIVANTPTLSFLTKTVLHDATCKNAAWYGVELRTGMVVGDGATFKGAYNAIYTPVTNAATNNLSLMNCYFEANYLGIRLNRSVTFSSTFGNTFGDAAFMRPWPGLTLACTWVDPIGKPQAAAPFAGIYAETPAAATLVSLVFPNNLTSTPNLFINLSNGIYMHDANGTVRQSRFQNMLSGAYTNDDGYGIHLFSSATHHLAEWGLGKTNTTLTFDNCRHAIHVEMPQNTAAASTYVGVRDNNMSVQHGCTIIGGYARIRNPSVVQDNQITYTAQHGVLVENTSVNSKISVLRNSITGITPAGGFGVGVFLDHFTPIALGTADIAIVKDNNAANGGGIFGGARGVSIGQFENVLVENNLVRGFLESGIGNTASTGNRIRCNIVNSALANTQAIFLHLAPASTVSYNQTDNTTHGLQVTQVCNNSLLLCNEIGSHNNGLFFDASGESSAQLPTMSSAGNTWTGTYTANAALMVFGGTPANSIFYYRVNEKTFNQIYLTTSFVDVAPSEAQLLEIRAIGEQCSSDGGRIVFSARNWYHTLTGTRIEGDCDGVAERDASGRPEAGTQVLLQVSPNPAGDRARISVQGTIPAGASIGIYDVAGKLRKTIQAPAQGNAFELETAGLANGTYVCRLSDARGGFLATVKFNIQH